MPTVRYGTVLSVLIVKLLGLENGNLLNSALARGDSWTPAWTLSSMVTGAHIRATVQDSRSCYLSLGLWRFLFT